MNQGPAEEAVSDTGAILVINSGSSSVKFAGFNNTETLERIFSGAVERIGLEDARFYALDGKQEPVVDQTDAIPDHAAALDRILQLDAVERFRMPLQAVGHRIVHGGQECDCPLAVTPDLEQRLKKLVPLAPLHLPHNLAGIAAVRAARPDLPQIACFDTAFHSSLPAIATRLPLPRQYHEQGVRRFGFHGLSYEYIVHALREQNVDVDNENMIIAHLGNGASMCAISGGRSIETTMGFSALGGLPMGTRSGDLDPGVVLYLQSEMGLSVDALQHLLYQESGLLGVSGLSRNMKDLLQNIDNQAAAEAVELFCYQGKKHLTALTSVLGGLNRLVFTGGIGANAPEIRDRICRDLKFLGIEIDAQANHDGDQFVSTGNSDVIVQILETDEQLMIACHTHDLLNQQQKSVRGKA